MMKKPRRKIDAALKAKIALEALREQTLSTRAPSGGTWPRVGSRTMPPARTIVLCAASGNGSSSTAIEDMRLSHVGTVDHKTRRTGRPTTNGWKTQIYRYLCS